MDSPEISIIPKPLLIQAGSGQFTFDSGVVVNVSDGHPELGPEGYQLTIDDTGITFMTGTRTGMFYAEQTLKQLLPPDALRTDGGGKAWPLPHVQITDAPRFRWRGAMLDVARHFLTKRQVLRFLDLMALHKLNVLHFHLTEDQGWRVEIKQYPKLTEVGGWRRETLGDGKPHGGFYTQDDIREIVAYAAERHITVVPEIDIPGHSTAAIAAYPELGNQDVPSAREPREVWTEFGIAKTVLNVEDATVEFYKTVMDEVCDLFPGEFVCLGGDECPKEEWKASARAQERKAELGLATEEDLQAWFMHQISEHVAAKGRKLLGWDEILEGELFPGTVVSSWRGTDGAVEAARRGHDTLTSPTQWVYFDYRQSDAEGEPGAPWAAPTTLEKAYSFEPVPADMPEELAGHVIGSEATLWSEYIPDVRIHDYQSWPRLAAFCETVWSAPDRDYAEFLPRLTKHLERLDALGVEYRPLDGPHPWQKQPAPRWRQAPEDGAE